jgi:hypothetical protein
VAAAGALMARPSDRSLDEPELRRALAAAINVVTDGLAIYPIPNSLQLCDPCSQSCLPDACLLKPVVEVCLRRLATPDEKNEFLTEKPQQLPLLPGRLRNTLLNIMLIIGA